VNPVVPGSGLLIMKLALSLGLVVGLILVLQKAARKWGHALGAGGGPEAIRMLSQRSVGPRLSLAVVEVRGRTLLVGISPQGIHAVADLDVSSPPDGARRAAGYAGPEGVPAAALGSTFEAVGRDCTPATPAAGVTAVGPPPTVQASVRGFLERWGLRPRGAASFAATTGRPAGRGGCAPRRGSAPPAVFEEELLARLASLRDRYPSLSDLEKDAAEAWR
jgi:flagellar biogenesis protein FliO